MFAMKNNGVGRLEALKHQGSFLGSFRGRDGNRNDVSQREMTSLIPLKPRFDRFDSHRIGTDAADLAGWGFRLS